MFLTGILFFVIPFCGTNTNFCFVVSTGFISASVLLIVWKFDTNFLAKKKALEEESKYDFSVRTKFTDNNTGKTSDVFISGNDIEKLSDGMSKFIQASALLVNLNTEDLNTVKLMIEEKIKNGNK